MSFQRTTRRSLMTLGQQQELMMLERRLAFLKSINRPGIYRIRTKRDLFADYQDVSSRTSFLQKLTEIEPETL